MNGKITNDVVLSLMQYLLMFYIIMWCFTFCIIFFNSSSVFLSICCCTITIVEILLDISLTY